MTSKPASGTADAAADMRKLADAYSAAWRARDVDGILAWHAPDTAFHLHAPGFGEVTGHEALREQFVALFSAWPDLEFRTIRLTVAKDSFTHEMKMSGTPAGATPPGDERHEPGAGRVEFDAVDVIAVADGVVVRKDTYVDSAGLAKQLDAVAHEEVNADLGPSAQGLTGDFEKTAADLLAKFRRLWEVRDPAMTLEIVAPDVVARWSGSGIVRGDEYPERWRSLVLETFDELEFEITGHAAEDPFLFISWHVRATVGSQAAEGDGVDRLRVRGDRVDEVLVMFDTAPMVDLLSRGSATRHQGA